MTALLQYGTTAQADLFNALPIHVMDPFPLLEVDGRTLVCLPASEKNKVAGLDVELLDPSELGRDEMLAQGVADWEVDLAMAEELCRRAGVTAVTVPAELPVFVADRLRARRIEVTVDPVVFMDRRRAKSPSQLDGIRRACAAADAAMVLAGELIRAADGSLTSEEVRARMAALCDERGCDLPDDVIVAGGAQAAVGHESGTGPLRPGDAVVVDIWPRDRASGCWSDTTRTFVAGGGEPHPDIARWHALACESVRSVLARVRPGVGARELWELSCEPFEREGQPTTRSKAPGEVLRDGYWWGLGHGVGLEVHERPYLGRSTDVIVEGDVLAVEPGCVREGFGQARIEDLVLVTADGPEVLTTSPWDLT